MAQESKQQGKVKGGEEGIVRMAGRDISGRYNIPHALMQIKGVGHNMANALALGAEKTLNISRDTKIGTLSEEQLSKLEGILKDPLKVKVPQYLLNRRKEMDSGSDMHLILQVRYPRPSLLAAGSSLRHPQCFQFFQLILSSDLWLFDHIDV